MFTYSLRIRWGQQFFNFSPKFTNTNTNTNAHWCRHRASG